MRALIQIARAVFFLSTESNLVTVDRECRNGQAPYNLAVSCWLPLVQALWCLSLPPSQLLLSGLYKLSDRYVQYGAVSMCFFPIPNTNDRGAAYKAGLTEFDCGVCPECLKKRASRMMVRDVAEASCHKDNCMITLTYDSFIYDDDGKIIGERVSDRSVDKRDVQLFVKRLRQHVWRRYKRRIKYRVSAEYGKRTGRPHYHMLIFGFTFPDAVYFRDSDRGNTIYQSAALTALWGQGICTVDSKHVNAQIARYVSKYTSKDHGRSVDTFSLCSQGIGIEKLYRDFNGSHYMIDGVRYPIPRQVWERYIVDKYKDMIALDPRYVPRSDESMADGSFQASRMKRELYRRIRDLDPVYMAYIASWRGFSEQFQAIQAPVKTRILLLPNEKYGRYKIKAIEALNLRNRGFPRNDPRRKNRYYYYPPHHGDSLYDECFKDVKKWEEPCRIPSRQYTASDTPIRIGGFRCDDEKVKDVFRMMEYRKKIQQISIRMYKFLQNPIDWL